MCRGGLLTNGLNLGYYTVGGCSLRVRHRLCWKELSHLIYIKLMNRDSKSNTKSSLQTYASCFCNLDLYT